MAQDCTEKTAGIKDYSMIVGLCKGTSCSNTIGGCAEDIPSQSVVLDTQDDETIAKKRATHEMGHALGLYHILSENGTNGCEGDELGTCLGPNADDCNSSAEERSKNIMTYCPLREDYGVTGYNYLKTVSLKKYLEGCR